jgi:hypothetical protein
MTRWQFFVALWKRSFHGAFRFLEPVEAVLATAMYAAMFFFPELGKAFKLLFVIVAVLFFLTLAVSLFVAAYSLYFEQHEARTVAELQLDQREQRKHVRVELGNLLERGQSLLVRCQDEKQSPPTDEANRWSADTEGFLGGQFDTSFIARFRSVAGLLAETTLTSPAHRVLWQAIYRRLTRLQQFLEELARHEE